MDKDSVLAVLKDRFVNVFFYYLGEAELIVTKKKEEKYAHIYGAQIKTDGGTYTYAFAAVKDKKDQKTMLAHLDLSSFHIRTYPNNDITTTVDLWWQNLGAPQYLNTSSDNTSLKDLNICEDCSCRQKISRTYTSSDKSFKLTLFTEEAMLGSVNDLPSNTSVIPAIDTLDVVIEF